MSEQKKQKESSFFQFLKENKTVAVLMGVVAVVVIAAAVIIGIFVGKGARPASSGVSQETSAQEQASESGGTLAVPLEEEAYPQVRALMEAYYQAAASGDMDKIGSLVRTYDQETLINLEKLSAYIEEYRNLKCYTKAGHAENSYVVYAYYETKFKDLDEPVPGISPYLVYTDEDGSCYIYEGEVDESTNFYLEEVSAQDDVVDLMNRVQVAFNEAVVADENLNNYLAQMKADLEVEVGEALAEAEAQQTRENGEPQVGEAVISADEVKAKEVVNVRASDSEQAERIGKVQTGDVLKLLESRANGWSKVEYEGKEAYIKTEFLEPVAAGSEGSAEEQPGNTEGQEDAGSQNSAGVSASSDIPASGTVMVAETVNVRKSANESAEKLGVCYQGGKLEIVMQQADGWTKVRFEGKTGYVKTDVLKVMK